MVRGDLQLAHHRDPARNEVQHLIERGHGLSLARIGAGELFEAGLTHGARQVRRAVEGVVVEEHGDAVGAEVEVDLHGVGAGEGSAHTRKSVGGGLARGGGVRDDDGSFMTARG